MLSPLGPPAGGGTNERIHWHYISTGSGCRHVLAFSDLHSQAHALLQVTSLTVFLYFIFVLIFFIESLNI